MKSNQLDITVERLKEIGLLNHLDTETINTILEQAKEQNKTPEQFIYHTPGLMFGFDAENYWDENTYSELFVEISKISHGEFVPQNMEITKETDNQSLEGEEYLILTYELNGQSYSQKLEYFYDWADLNFLRTFNQSLEETNSNGCYYWVDTKDQVVVLIFLTDEQHEFVKDVLGRDLKNIEEMYN